MNKSTLTTRIARISKTTKAEAADYLDLAVLSILKSWKHGQPVLWPGLGAFNRDLAKPLHRKSAKSEVR